MLCIRHSLSMVWWSQSFLQITELLRWKNWMLLLQNCSAEAWTASKFTNQNTLQIELQITAYAWNAFMHHSWHLCKKFTFNFFFKNRVNLKLNPGVLCKASTKFSRRMFKPSQIFSNFSSALCSLIWMIYSTSLQTIIV
jgi:hypothetical protein